MPTQEMEIRLAPSDYEDAVRAALAEDLGRGDRTSELTVEAGTPACGKLTAKESLIVAGLPVAEFTFKRLAAKADWSAKTAEGERVAASTVLAEVSGDARALLAAERVALNFLQHLSGIATLTGKFVEKLRDTSTLLRDTRKTLPGLRALEKYAVRVGGGINHRFRLDDGVLIKGNHLHFAGGVRAALEKVRQTLKEPLPIEIEVTSFRELQEAVEARADEVLLDNMTPDEVRECVGWVEANSDPGRVKLEISGGVDLENIRAYAETGVDFIAVGALTHSARAVDIHFPIGHFPGGPA